MSSWRKDRRRWFGILMATLLVSTPCTSMARQPVTGSGDWYYRIGGAAPISPAPNANARSIRIDGSVALQLPRACGSLDPAIAISNLLDDIASGVDQLDELLVLAANEAIAALPAIILQRANPGLYEHFQNALLKAQRIFELSVKSCREIVEDVEEGRNPLNDWVKIAKRDTWQRLLQDTEVDSVDAEVGVDELNGDEGVPWIGGNRGGIDQDPIEVVRDTTEAGYNVTLGRPADAVGPPGVVDARLVELWATPDEAGAFAAEALGDHIIRTCQGCAPSTTAGVGLMPAYEAEREVINETLTALVAGDQLPDAEALEEISAASVRVTPQLIEAIRETREPQERAVIVGRLAGDIALARTVERALAIRRLLLTGRKVPEVATNAVAMAQLRDTDAELEQEIATLLYESRIQKELVSATAGVVLDRAERARQAALSQAGAVERQPEDLLLQGRVRPE